MGWEISKAGKSSLPEHAETLMFQDNLCMGFKLRKLMKRGLFYDKNREIG